MHEESRVPLSPQPSETQADAPAEATPPPRATQATTHAPDLLLAASSWQLWLRVQVIPVVLAFALGVAVGYIMWGLARSNATDARASLPAPSGPPASLAGGNTSPGANPQAPAPPAQPQASPTPTRIQVSVDDDPARGPEDAPIVMIEFSDYECPFCKKWRVEVYDILFEQYGDVVRFVYRDFPIQSIHPEAVPAAVAANCAGEQGKYWEFHDLLFLGGRKLGRETYIAYAEELGLDMEAFIPCLDSEEQRQEVLADFNDGVRLGVRGTPTFFINGIPVVGAQPFPVFQNIIEQELARLAQEGN